MLGVLTLGLVHLAIGSVHLGRFLQEKYFSEKDTKTDLDPVEIKSESIKERILKPEGSEKEEKEESKTDTPSIKKTNSPEKVKLSSDSPSTSDASAKALSQKTVSPTENILPSIEDEEITPEFEENLESEMEKLEQLADSLHLYLPELIRAKEEGNFEEVVQEAEEVERKCQETFEKLDRIYEEVEGQLVTKNPQERIVCKMTIEELDVIKNVVRSAYKALAKHPKGPKEKIEQVVHISTSHHILVETAEDSFKMVGLFGKLIGYGGAGAAVRTLNNLEGTWVEGEEAVLKIPMASDEDSEQILQEETLLKKIHSEQLILGIQKPLRVIRNIFTGLSKHCHLGSLYQTTLFHMILHPEEKKELKLLDKMNFAYQIFHGICHMHKKNITNGDVKPENLFIDEAKEGKISLLFLSDFGGGIDHSAETVPLQLTVSPEYRLKEDMIVSKSAHKENNRELYVAIEKKADVFAGCIVICSIFTSELPYKELPASGNFTLNNNLQQQLIDAGLSLATAQLIIQGLEVDYAKRPDGASILNAIATDLEAFSPELHAHLLSLSQPL